MKISPDGLFILNSYENHMLELFQLNQQDIETHKYYQHNDENSKNNNNNKNVDCVNVEKSTSSIDTNTNNNNNMKSVQQLNIGESIYDIDWYPHMCSNAHTNSDAPEAEEAVKLGDSSNTNTSSSSSNSNNEPNINSNTNESNSNTTTCYITSSKDRPIHLYDCFSNELRGSYSGINALDELDPAICIRFNRTGDRIYAGTSRMIRYSRCIVCVVCVWVWVLCVEALAIYV